MYLLNPIGVALWTSEYFDLHSTMYLLNPFKQAQLYLPHIFTFHYVSIKSLARQC